MRNGSVDVDPNTTREPLATVAAARTLADGTNYYLNNCTFTRDQAGLYYLVVTSVEAAEEDPAKYAVIATVEAFDGAPTAATVAIEEEAGSYGTFAIRTRNVAGVLTDTALAIVVVRVA